MYGTSLQLTKLHGVLQKTAKCVAANLKALSWAPWKSGKLCFIVLHIVTDLQTMYYDEPHGTIFDSLAGSQKPGNDHGTNCTFTAYPLSPPPPPQHHHCQTFLSLSCFEVNFDNNNY